MGSLQFLQFPIEDPPSDYPREVCLTLRQVYPAPVAAAADTAIYTISNISEGLTYRKRGMKRVYRATMIIEPTGESKTVVCKIAMGRTYFAQLQREGRMYDERVKELQGTVVPHVYGFFVGKSFDGKTGVLVMDDCGVPLRMHYSRYPLGFKKSLVDGFVALHPTARVVHGDFDRSHVVARRLPDGKLHATLLSFGKVGVNHKCRFEGEIVPDARGPGPTENRVPCPELWEVVYLSEIYTPATVEYFGEDVPVEWAKDPDTLFRMGGRPKGCSEVQARAHAKTICAEYAEWLECRAECDEKTFEL